MSFVALEHVDVVRGGRTVLHDVSLTIAEGECVALLGPNGCGKSTLLKVLTCELYPVARPDLRVDILGRPRWDVTELRRRLGVVAAELPGKPMLALSGIDAVLTGFFSSSTLWPHLQVTDAMRDAAHAALQRLGSAGLASRTFGAMSAGQQRRVLIARALVASAGCLLLDEPSNALDLAAQGELRDVLAGLATEGTTVVHITHTVADIGPECGRVLMLRDGRLVADGTREELLTEARLGALFGRPVRLAEHAGRLLAW